MSLYFQDNGVDDPSSYYQILYDKIVKRYGFRPEKLCCGQVLNLTQYLEDDFETKRNYWSSFHRFKCCIRYGESQIKFDPVISFN